MASIMPEYERGIGGGGGGGFIDFIDRYEYPRTPRNIRTRGKYVCMLAIEAFWLPYLRQRVGSMKAKVP